MKKIFDNFKLEKYVDMIKYDPISAEYEFEKYIENYPYDYSAYPHYAHSLLVLGKTEDAIKIMNYVEEKSQNDTNYAQFFQKNDYLKSSIIINKYRILAQLEKYDELYEYYNKTHFLISSDFNIIPFVCEKKLGLLDSRRDYPRYYFNQAAEYKEEDFLKHIQKHMADYKTSSDMSNQAIFSPYFKIDEVLKEIKRIIPSNKKLCTGIFEDTYYFKYNDCGRDHNKITDFFLVVTFHNTNEIITMCPIVGIENCPHEDLNFLNKDKVKVISQIEKFNRKYKKKSK